MVKLKVFLYLNEYLQEIIKIRNLFLNSFLGLVNKIHLLFDVKYLKRNGNSWQQQQTFLYKIKYLVFIWNNMLLLETKTKFLNIFRKYTV